MAREFIRNTGSFAAEGSRPAAPAAQTSERGFTSTSEVLDIPPFKERALNTVEQAFVDAGVLEIPMPIIELATFTEGLDNVDDGGEAGMAQAQQGDSGLQFAEVINFPAKFEFNKEFTDFVSAMKNVVKYEIEPNPFRSVILYGETGTGKTTGIQQMVFELQQTTSREVIYLTTDYGKIQSSLVGQAEKNIVAMKQQISKLPKDKYYVLHIDEIDSFFPARNNSAQHRADFVNEMIKFMDGLPANVMFIGTTNLIDTFDSAILRRFKQRIEFKDYTAEYKTRVLLGLEHKYKLKYTMLENIDKYKIFHLQQFAEDKYKQEITNTRSEVMKHFILNKQKLEKERAEKLQADNKKQKEKFITKLNDSSKAHIKWLKDNRGRLSAIEVKDLDIIESLEKLETMNEQDLNDARQEQSEVNVQLTTKKIFLANKNYTDITRFIADITNKLAKEYEDANEDEEVFLTKIFANESGMEGFEIKRYIYKALAESNDSPEDETYIDIEHANSIQDIIDDMKGDANIQVILGYKDEDEYMDAKLSNVVVKEVVVNEDHQKEVDDFMNDKTKLAVYIGDNIYVKERLVVTLAMQERDKYAPAPNQAKVSKVEGLENKFGSKDVEVHKIFKDNDAPLENNVFYAKSVTLPMYENVSLIRTYPKVAVNGHGVLFLTPQEWIKNLKGKNWIVVGSILNKGGQE